MNSPSGLFPYKKIMCVLKIIGEMKIMKKINWNSFLGYGIRFVILAILTVLITMVSISNITYAVNVSKEDEIEGEKATTLLYEEEPTVTYIPPVIIEEEKEPVYVPFDYYECVVDKDVQKYVRTYIKKYGDKITADVVYSVIYAESRFDENATNGKTNCQGYMQLNPKYFNETMLELGYESLYDREGNIELGVMHLSYLMDKYGDLGIALMCYERGEDGGVAYYERNHKYDSYANSIINRVNERKGFYGEYEYTE